MGDVEVAHNDFDFAVGQVAAADRLGIDSREIAVDIRFSHIGRRIELALIVVVVSDADVELPEQVVHRRIDAPAGVLGIERNARKFGGEAVFFVDETPPLARVRRLDGFAKCCFDARVGMVEILDDEIVDRFLNGDEDGNEVDFPTITLVIEPDSSP